jgi:hypothetical protein
MARRKEGLVDDIRNRVGAFFGGNGGRDVNAPRTGLPADRFNRPPTDQTYFTGRENQWTNYPRPQSIRKMPRQLAGYDDNYNTRGQIASTANMDTPNWFGETFLSDIQKVYINQAFAEPASRIGNDPDSRKRSTNFKPLPAYRVKQLQKRAKGVARFADSASKYFDKDFETLQVPNQYPSDAGNYLSTLQLNIRGYEEGKNTRSAGYVSMWSSYFRPPSKKTGPETRKITGPWRADMHLNTNMPDIEWYYRPREAGGTVMHEFLHNLGMGHPVGYNDNEAKNSKLSYDSTAYAWDEYLHPADINVFQDTYKKIEQEKMRNSPEYRKRAASAYRGVAKKRK